MPRLEFTDRADEIAYMLISSINSLQGHVISSHDLEAAISLVVELLVKQFDDVRDGGASDIVENIICSLAQLPFARGVIVDAVRGALAEALRARRS